MTRLDCNVEKCAYNADNCCKLREIDVKGTKAKKACDTQCGSFSNKACDCEVSAELAIHKETDVHCDSPFFVVANRNLLYDYIKLL